jgi:hypothetical protein
MSFDFRSLLNNQLELGNNSTISNFNLSNTGNNLNENFMTQVNHSSNTNGFSQISQLYSPHLLNENNFTQRIDQYNINHNSNYENNIENSHIYSPNQNQLSILSSHFEHINYHCNSELCSEFSYQTNFDEEIHKKLFYSRSRMEYDIRNMPVLKLLQYRLNTLTNETEIHKVYYITPFGLKDTQRDAIDFEVKIGRMQLDENENISNDIILLDRSISRFHCKIDFKDGFKKIDPLPEEFLAIFMMNHPRLGQNINVKNLDQLNLINICSYMKIKREFRIQDSGSILGTYIRLKRNHVVPLKMGQIFSIGSEFTLVVHNIKINHQVNQLHGNNNGNQNNLSGNLFNNELCQILLEERKSGAVIIGNFSEEFKQQLQLAESFLELGENSNIRGNLNNNNGQSLLMKSPVPFLEVVIHHQINNQEVSRRL